LHHWKENQIFNETRAVGYFPPHLNAGRTLEQSKD